MRVYEVVGWRKEYYKRCERELHERQERVLQSEAVIKNPEKYNHLKDRKDIKFKPQAYDFLRGKHLEAEIVPYRRTKEGKALYEEWERVLEGDFGLIFRATQLPKRG